ncbi:MAG TPA: dTDP-4-dehydrorhamnose 3,5-epimerase [Anaerolineaceae bacterium]|nr:dTDP-4-dehydrorhamnose 3,5-epimerase [Anaerolineaceae bacterium]
MDYIKTALPEVVLIVPKVFGDARGFFLETYRESEFKAQIGPQAFVQDNHSGSKQGILRGLHYQLKHAQGKLVRAVVGEIFDVAVDLRPGSPTFGQWSGEVLSAENKYQLWIPAGFAHGFYVMSEWAEVYYKATDYYDQKSERGIHWNDPAIGIEWPLIPGVETLLSAKDANAPLLRDAEIYPRNWVAKLPAEEAE